MKKITHISLYFGCVLSGLNSAYADGPSPLLTAGVPVTCEGTQNPSSIDSNQFRLLKDGILFFSAPDASDAAIFRYDPKTKQWTLCSLPSSGGNAAITSVLYGPIPSDSCKVQDLQTVHGDQLLGNITDQHHNATGQLWLGFTGGATILDRGNGSGRITPPDGQPGPQVTFTVTDDHTEAKLSGCRNTQVRSGTAGSGPATGGAAASSAH